MPRNSTPPARACRRRIYLGLREDRAARCGGALGRRFAPALDRCTFGLVARGSAATEVAAPFLMSEGASRGRATLPVSRDVRGEGMTTAGVRPAAPVFVMRIWNPSSGSFATVERHGAPLRHGPAVIPEPK